MAFSERQGEPTRHFNITVTGEPEAERTGRRKKGKAGGMTLAAPTAPRTAAFYMKGGRP